MLFWKRGMALGKRASKSGSILLVHPCNLSMPSCLRFNFANLEAETKKKSPILCKLFANSRFLRQFSRHNTGYL